MTVKAIADCHFPFPTNKDDKTISFVSVAIALVRQAEAAARNPSAPLWKVNLPVRGTRSAVVVGTAGSPNPAPAVGCGGPHIRFRRLVAARQPIPTGATPRCPQPYLSPASLCADKDMPRRSPPPEIAIAPLSDLRLPRRRISPSGSHLAGAHRHPQLLRPRSTNAGGLAENLVGARDVVAGGLVAETSPEGLGPLLGIVMSG